jgi:uncharacterized membrane protein YkvA (DUF1232 family)
MRVGRAAALKVVWDAVRGARRPGAPGIAERLAAFPRMVRMGMSGRYPHLDRGRLGLMALGVLYVVSPIDLVPELIVPLVGLGDDAFVLAWVAGAMLDETGAFVAWERAAVPTVAGEVVS